MAQSPFVGSWSYRSITNDPDIAKELDDIQMQKIILTLEEPEFGRLGGTMGPEDGSYSLELRGEYYYGEPFSFRLRSFGSAGPNVWIHDNIGYLVPSWYRYTLDGSVNQKPVIVGSVMRVHEHLTPTGGKARAGLVGTFYAIKRD